MEKTEQALRCFSSEKTESYWRFRVLKAEILHRQGRDSESLELLKPELPAFLSGSDLAVRRKLAQAMASAFTQRLEDADRFLGEAQELAKTNHPEMLGEVAMKTGTLRFFQGDMQQAEAEYHQALRGARETNDQFLEAAALEGLGVVATRKELYDEAIDWLRAALGVARAVGAQHSTAETLGNIAWSYRKLGDYENALTLYKQAVEASARNGAVSDRIYWLTGIENVYYEQHDYAAAEAVLQQGLDMARRQDDKGTLVEFLNDLSEIAVETGRNDLAEKYQQEAAEIEKVSPDEAVMRESALIRGRIHESKGEYAAAEEHFQRVISDPKAGSSLKWEAEARLARVYAEQGLRAKAEKEFRQSLDTIEAARSSVKSEELRMSFLATAISFYSNYIEFLIGEKRITEALQVAELSRARTLEEGLGENQKTQPSATRSIRPQEIAARLKATLLFYWVGQTHSYLWVITPTKLSCFPLPKESEIGSLVQAYRQAILQGHDVLATDGAAGEQLYTMLVAPAREFLPKNAHVILLPAGSLYGLNFEALIVPYPKPHFWIEDATIASASSLTLLSSTDRKAQNRDKTLLLVGNPEPPNSEFPPLSQAAEEIRKISTHFPDSRRQVLEGKGATASAYFRNRPERFSYLHFAAHGTASQTRPLESAVILSREDDSYKLYARDIVGSPLSAELVTISACNGAGTRAFAGEGLVGLSWAFLRAGARNVIASLWEVSDAPSTTQMMDSLYDGLNRGEDPATALRDAKLRLLRSNSDTVFHKPFYWAPFQLYAGS